MKKIGLFTLGFALFFSIVSVMALGAVAFVYLAACFIAWDILGVDQLTENALVAIRVVVVIAFLVTTSWIFTDGRKEWDV